MLQGRLQRVDLSMNHWTALIPHELVKEAITASLRHEKRGLRRPYSRHIHNNETDNTPMPPRNASIVFVANHRVHQDVRLTVPMSTTTASDSTCATVQSAKQRSSFEFSCFCQVCHLRQAGPEVHLMPSATEHRLAHRICGIPNQNPGQRRP